MTEQTPRGIEARHPTVLITSHLEAEHVERIAAAVPCEVLYDPDLVPRPRYRNDHGGARPELDDAGQARWRELLALAEVCFDFDWWAPADLPVNAPRLEWVQATSAGIGGFVERYGLGTAPFAMTTAAGVHAVPLAEFALLGALHFAKDVPYLQRQQRDHTWERHVCGQLAGRRATVVGLGGIGREVVRTFDVMGVQVTGVGRPGAQYDLPESVRQVSTTDLDEVLPDTDVLVLACPLTRETTNLIDARRIDLLPAGAVLVNVARGQVVDELALTAALAGGRLCGAALDVFATEPLPADSPLWDLPNVLVSPHSASTASGENAALTDLFIDNLRRFVTERPLRNLYRPARGY
ncbi:MAG: D-2-hydroxyacid dehydrogenase [Motilibacteraceae bacterium]